MKIDNRIWVILTVLISGALLAGAWFLGVSPFLAAAASSAANAAEVSTANTQTERSIASLQAQRAKLPELKSRLAALRNAVPAGVEGTALIDEVDAISSSTGAQVTSITLGDPVAYTSPAPAAAAPATSTGAGPSPSPSASASATAAPVPTGPAAPAVVTDGLITGTNFLVVPVTVMVKGSGDQTSAFLHGLQYGDRLILVTALSRATDTNEVTLTITGSAFVTKTDATAAAAGASANG